MNHKETDFFEIVIVGAGAAGIAAARAAHEAGCRRILLLDSGAKMGGVLLRCTHRGFGPQLTGQVYVERLICGFPENVQVWLNTTVLSVKNRYLILSGRETGVRKVYFDQMILSAGCLEIPLGFLPVAGTRPEGIYTAGQVQEMVNVYGELPEEPAVILGSGDLGLILAEQLSARGIRIAAMVEQKSACGGMAKNQERIRNCPIPLLCSSAITEVSGDRRLREVKIRNLLTGEESSISCRSLLIAAGLKPDRSLLQGILPEYIQGTDQRKNGYREEQAPTETELPDWIHLCGNCHRVHPMIEMVIKEGKQAGISAFEKIRGYYA